MRRGIIYIDENYAEFGPVPESKDNIRIMCEGRKVWGISYESLKDHLGFDYLQGCYVIGEDVNEHYFPFGRELFPYNLDTHTYNTKFVEHLFKGRQLLKDQLEFKYVNELPYTFGLEFETAGGFLPQHRLYELGLIPLRDGSITGIEFSTVVLKDNCGLNLLKQQMSALNERTIFDKDFSLNIHFGDFKLDGEVLLMVNNLFCASNIANYLPQLTFSTHLYKSNKEKNYCEMNQKYASFAGMYTELVGRDFYGDFTQPHPKDINGTRKWNIRSRYRAVNFINALCYKSPKTIEFRILRPTYNFDKVLGWLFVFSAFIKYAEQNYTNNKYLLRNRITVEQIIQTVYSHELADILCNFLKMSHRVVDTQESLGDNFGMRVDIEDKVINYNTFGHYFY